MKPKKESADIAKLHDEKLLAACQNIPLNTMDLVSAASEDITHLEGFLNSKQVYVAVDIQHEGTKIAWERYGPRYRLVLYDKNEVSRIPLISAKVHERMKGYALLTRLVEKITEAVSDITEKFEKSEQS